MPAIVERNQDASYSLVGTATARFGSLNELMQFADEHKISLALNEYTFAYKLGEMAVTLSESGLDFQKIIHGLDDSTDTAWVDAARSLGKILTQWADNDGR